MTLEAINPATGVPLSKYEEMTAAEVGNIVAQTHDAFLAWRRLDFAERARPMRNAAQILRNNAMQYARLMAQEMGKPIKDGIAEAQKCATGCDYLRSMQNAFWRASRS